MAVAGTTLTMEASADEATTRPPLPTQEVPVAELQERMRQGRRMQNILILIPSIILINVSALLLPFAAGHTTYSGMLVRSFLIAGLVLGLIGATFVFCRRHTGMRREAGYSTACFDCIELRAPADPWNPQSLAHLREVRHMPDAQSMRTELRFLSALQEIRERPWEGGEVALECSLCMDVVHEGASIKQLPCQHAFHTKCIDRWLFHAQRGQRRRCPLCNVDPLQGLVILPRPQSPNGTSTGYAMETSGAGASTYAESSAEESQAAATSPPHPGTSPSSSPSSPPSAWAERRRWAWHVILGEPEEQMTRPPSPSSATPARRVAPTTAEEEPHTPPSNV